MEYPVYAGGGGGAGGGSSTLQQAYSAGETIAVTSADGAIAISNSADATDLVTLSRTFAGAGIALAISMGATTTGVAIDMDMVAGAAGNALRVHQGATNYLTLGPTGALLVSPASAQSVTFTMNGATWQVNGASSSILSVDSGGSMVLRVAQSTGSTNRVIQMDDAGADTRTSTFGKYMTVIPRFQPGSGSASWAAVQINPTINGTSSGTAACLVVASKTNTLTGGVVNLVDFGTTSTDYGTGYTSVWRLTAAGDIEQKAGAAATAVHTPAASSSSSGVRQVQTTDATVTTIATIPTSSDRGYVVRAMVVGTRVTGTNETGAYEVICTFENDAGTLTQVSTDTQPHVKEDTAAWDVTINPSGTNILVQVTGEAAKTINWTCLYEVIATA